jgi:hypothetical protein
MTTTSVLQKCAPEAIASLIRKKQGKSNDNEDIGSGSILPGGWTEVDDFKSDVDKLNKWIKNSLYKFQIYYDKEDKLEIQSVYTQVVAGVNYWIYFQMLPTGEHYWLQVIEPLGTAGTVKILSLIPCIDDSKNNSSSSSSSLSK